MFMCNMVNTSQFENCLLTVFKWRYIKKQKIVSKTFETYPFVESRVSWLVEKVVGLTVKERFTLPYR